MLQISHVHKTFNAGTVNERTIFSDFSLHILPEDFVTIIGSNGSGKSTLFNLIAGHLLSDEGQIFLDGQDITLMPDYRRAKMIGHLFQNPLLGTAPHMTIEENLLLASGHGAWLSLPSKQVKNQIRERLAELDLGLENKVHERVGLLSGGQRQALTLLMATYQKPKLLLLDEHTAALDPETADKIMKMTKKVVEENRITCLMIAHNMQSALDFGNRTLMMAAGNVILDVTGDERKNMRVQDLLEQFKKNAADNVLSDRVLLS